MTILSPDYSVTWISCHLTILSPNYHVIWLFCHMTIPSPDSSVSWLSFHLTILSHNYPVTCLSCHLTILSPDYPIIWPSCHMTILSPDYHFIWLSCHLSILSPDYPVAWLSSSSRRWLQREVFMLFQVENVKLIQIDEPVYILYTSCRHPVDTLGSWVWCQDCSQSGRPRMSGQLHPEAAKVGEDHYIYILPL